MTVATAPARPWIALILVGAALVAASIPGASEQFQYDRAAVEAGEVWRLLTGQMVHWTPRMLVVDLTVLLFLGGWIESRSRRLAALTIVTGTVLVGAGLFLVTSDLARYRGASGIGSALFVAAALDLAAPFSRRWSRAAAGGLLSLFVIKLIWEQSTGAALAAGTLLPGVTVTPEVHLLGGLGGALAWIGSIRSTHGSFPRRPSAMPLVGHSAHKTPT